MDFQGKVAIVTGGAQGIGRATTLGLAREGATVLIADRDGPAAQTLAEGIVSWGGAAQALVADVSDEADAARIAAEAVSSFGGIDVLINNAGIQRPGSVESTPLESWNATLAVNLTGVYLVSRFVLPELRRRGGGTIVNVASLHGLVTEPGWAAYAASKGGVIALTRSMALDYAAENVRVNCVCPGAIDTSLLRAAAALERRQQPDAVLHEWAEAQPIGRLGAPEEVANLILFLAGPRSSFITGSVYTVDGGLGAGF
jgi:NAD(P)-dependent dehydrogenase (short-subunit alcohol dehydrogenase family)